MTRPTVAPPEPAPAPTAGLLEEKPERIAVHADAEGRERLDRSNVDVLVTSLIGGGEVSLGGLAAMAVTGAALAAVPSIGLYPALALGGLAFPIGFLFVIMGRSELFTENFLIPVVAVVHRERSIGSLLLLWLLSWLGNLAGSAVAAALIVLPPAVDAPILEAYRAYAEHKLELEPLPLLASAILAGAAMTALTWVLLALADPLGKIVAIAATGYLLFAANLAHSIVGASLLFVGYGLAGQAPADLLTYLVLSTVGNLVGGVGLVTLFRLAQAEEKLKQHRQEPPDRPTSAEGDVRPGRGGPQRLA
jgi:formate/nitrite transporter FocA (FNT family)